MDPKETKNVDGRKGKPCNYCGGYGFTNSVIGGSLGCARCQQTGVEPIDVRALTLRVDGLDKKLDAILSRLEPKRAL